MATGIGVGLGGWQLGRARARTDARSLTQAPPGQLLDPIPDRTPRPGNTFTGASGPWGQLEYIRLSIEPPRTFLPDPKIYAGKAEWFFEGLSVEQIEQALIDTGLTAEQMSLLAKKGAWDVYPDGAVIAPPLELVLGLSAATRARLYGLLARWEPNVFQRFPTPIEPETLDDPLQMRDLSPASVSLLRKLIFPRGSWSVFADTQAMMAMTSDPEERQRIVALTLRNRTFLVSLKVDTAADTAALERYWGYPSRTKSLEPLFRSLTRLREGSRLDLVHLLPPLPRRLLYTYPSPREAEANRRDCYWTSLNFFAQDAPNDQFVKPERALAALRRSYRLVQAPYGFGDVVVLHDASDGRPIHAAVHLADALVFTKNGRSSNQPWMLMKMDNMLSYYASVMAEGRRIVVRVYRRPDPG